MPSDPQRIQTVFLAAAEIHDPAERAASSTAPATPS